MKFKIKSSYIFSQESKADERNEDNDSESDYIEDTIGAASKWQVVAAFAASLTRFIALGNMTSVVFLTPATKFDCVEFEDHTTIAKDRTCYDNCTKYAYHSDVMETNLISDFGLICEKAWLQSLPQTIMMFGVVVGVAIFGWISDKFGRRVALIVSTALNLIFMISIAFVSNFWIFSCLRFIIGIASGGDLLSVNLVVELVGKRYREAASAFSISPDGIAEAFLALLAFYLPIWNNYLLGFSVPCILIFILICFVPESPRWLISNGKYDKAIELLERAAKINNQSTNNIRERIMEKAQAMKLTEKEEISTSYIDFFRVKSLRSLTVSTLCLWTIIGTSYYGIYQFVSLLSENVFITVGILGLIQVPVCFINIVITKLLKRKQSLAYTLVVTGCTLIISIFTPLKHWSTNLLGIIGFSSCSLSFGIIYIYEAELFPTKLRSKAFGLSSALAKLGAMVAPFIANIPSPWIPSAIFGVMALVGTVICILLPETKGKNLKD